MYYVVYVSFDFEVKVFGQVRWKSVVNKSELNTSASVRYKVYLIDADVFNSDLFSHHFNEEKQLQKMFIYYSISSVYLVNLYLPPQILTENSEKISTESLMYLVSIISSYFMP